MRRYAVFFAPPEGALSDTAARWLGWDAQRGCTVAHDASERDLDAATAEPRRYGFHGTLKAPFRLAGGTDRHGLERAVADLARRTGPVAAGPLRLRRIGAFLALVPDEPLRALAALASDVVDALEPFRAPLTEAEIARRKPASLTPRQRDLLDRYGYPYVREEFRFHLTLAGPLAKTAPHLASLAEERFAPWLGTPFRLDDLCLFGEDEGGRFHHLSRHALTG